jgi:hypothetical protein
LHVIGSTVELEGFQQTSMVLNEADVDGFFTENYRFDGHANEKAVLTTRAAISLWN